MKALQILENLKEYIETESRVGDLDYSHYSVMIDYVNESIEELEELKNRGYIGCINLTRSNSQDCISCSRQYQDNFKIIKNKQ